MVLMTPASGQRMLTIVTARTTELGERPVYRGFLDEGGHERQANEYARDRNTKKVPTFRRYCSPGWLSDART